jgi:hypothetical protein
MWGDYASDPNDRGVEITVRHHGKAIPFRIRRSLTIDERQRAADAAFTIELDENGKPKIGKQDQSAFTKETVFIGLKEWPFKYPGGGKVPITRKTIGELDGGLLDKLANYILGITEVDKAQLDPFGSPSDEASSKAEQPSLS